MKKIILRTLAVVGILILMAVVFTYIVFNKIMAVSQGQLIPKVEKFTSALLVIDIQEGTSGSLAAQGGYGERVLPFLKNVNQIIRQADSSGMVIAYIYQENIHWLINFLTHDVLAKGTPGTDLDRRLLVVNNQIFSKSTSDAFHNAELDTLLQKNNINHLVVVGLDISYCVNKTARGALNRGYQVTVIQDAVIGGSPETEKKMLGQFYERGIELMSTVGYLERMQQL